MNNKKNQQAYIARVAKNGHADTIVVITYDLDFSGRLTGYEFFKIITSLESPRLSIPFERQATFQEELLVLDKAAHAEETPTNTEKRIKEKLAEAYTTGELISVRKIENEEGA